MILISVIAGILLGIVSFLPLFLCFKASKKVTKTSNLGYGALMLLGVFGSVLILFASVTLCYFFVNENLLTFTLCCAITLIVIAICFGIYTAIKREKAHKERKKSKDR